MVKFGYSDTSSSVLLTLNFPPKGGSLEVPDEGIALTTVFRISMNGFFDEDTPLTYRFGYYFHNEVHYMTSWTNNNFLETKLPLGSYTSSGAYELTVVGVVSDSYGAETTV
jgi:hypothetical protein